MARRIAIPSKAVQLKIVGAKDTLIVPRIQRLTMTADRPSTDVDELGNRLHAGTVEDVPAITVTFQSMDVGLRLFSVLTGTSLAGAYPPSGVSISSLKELDAIINIKSDTVEDYIKMAHARRCTIRDFAFSYSVDGESTEEYTVIGSKKRWFTDDVIVEKFITGTTSFLLSQTPVALKDGKKALSVVLDGVYLDEVTGAPATGQYTLSGGALLETYDSRSSQLLAVYQGAIGGTAWADTSDTTQPAAIRGMDVPVVIATNGIERVQSVTINGTFNPAVVREMGNRDIVGYQPQIPAVTGTITVLDTDTQLIALFTTGQLNPADTEFNVSEFTFAGLTLDVKLQDPAIKTMPYPVIKTVYVPELVITSEGFTSNVNANAQQTFDFKSKTGDVVIYSGSRI